MSKLSRDGYVIRKKNFTTDQIKEFKDDLTMEPYCMNDFGEKNKKTFSIYLESPKKLYMPRYYGLSKLGEPEKNTLNDGKEIDINFKGSLRQEQLPVFDISYKQLMDTGGGIISLKCGGGKTILALYILAQIKKKTIIVVHKEFLMTQWYDRIVEFIPDAKIGKIQQNTIDVNGKDIVLAMVHSLSMKEYSDETFEDFGFCIYDECHHMGAEVFCKCMPKIACKYSLGLSATPKRKDGMSKVFEWYLGTIAYMSKEKNEDYVEVHIIKYMCENTLYNQIPLSYMKKPCVPKMINNICGFKPRRRLLIDLIIPLQKEGRSILILSDRRNHLEFIHDELEKIDIECGYYVGGMKPQELRDSQEKSIILGTFSMASEGMDIPKLNTIVLASPRSDVVQSVGRILRQKKEVRKFHPLIIDINDEFSSFLNQSKKRLTFYNKNKYDINITGLDGITSKYVKKSKRRTLNIEDINECLLD